VKTFTAAPTINEAMSYSTENKKGILNDYASTFVLTITNPLTILSFAAIFAGFGIGSDLSDDYLAASIMVIGIFLGSTTWWFILSGLTGYLRRRIGEISMIWFNRISGAIIFTFGLLALISTLY
jgi:threonine/homoserine/homoserine lactone efflux protein